ncbi:hypothetical protein J6590_069780 [Homalodisca vitripennis]|nr:hypothetical protein J6590_069780 [Homalodisca vitripennis]
MPDDTCSDATILRQKQNISRESPKSPEDIRIKHEVFPIVYDGVKREIQNPYTRSHICGRGPREGHAAARIYASKQRSRDDTALRHSVIIDRLRCADRLVNPHSLSPSGVKATDPARDYILHSNRHQ